jgi:hydrogenase maturation protease
VYLLRNALLEITRRARLKADLSATVLIGIGNLYRGDDGAGIVIARRVRAKVGESVPVIEESGDGCSLLNTWQNFSKVILVDAVSSAAPPGTIHRFNPCVDPIPRRFFRYSTHGFGVAHALDLARVLNKLPRSMMFFGIEGQNFGIGEGLSAQVEQAAESVLTQIVNELVTPAEFVSSLRH